MKTADTLENTPAVVKTEATMRHSWCDLDVTLDLLQHSGQMTTANTMENTTAMMQEEATTSPSLSQNSFGDSAPIMGSHAEASHDSPAES
mmetsp:Transcript_76682/g.194595  ORF Transcript_76682/g.194595 Transcript_76682/m.194595 type:complete len:90 (-) Transcript_76682:1166-1435(-)